MALTPIYYQMYNVSTVRLEPDFKMHLYEVHFLHLRLILRRTVSVNSRSLVQFRARDCIWAQNGCCPDYYLVSVQCTGWQQELRYI
jgi:hypothetical protein